MKDIIRRLALLPIFLATSQLMASAAFKSSKPKLSEINNGAEGDKDLTLSDAASNPSMVTAYELPNPKERLKTVFPAVQSIRKSQLLPYIYGGTSFMGLVGRLLGEATNRELEGIRTTRNIYYALSNDQVIGIAHPASFYFGPSVVHVVVFYTPGGTIKRVEVEGLPENIKNIFEKDATLAQFENFRTEDFEVIRGRRGRIVSRGTFLSKARRPKDSASREAFEKVLRSIRFNAAFMDVAYFITQHPDLADKPTQAFPEMLEFTGAGQPTSGPEAFIKDKILASPIDGLPHLSE